jgi:translation initiation factor IF-2
MNVTELARRLRVTPEELRDKMPQLGFAIGRRAVKVDNRVAQQVIEAWSEMRRRERLTNKIEEQKAAAEAREKRREEAASRPVELPPVITVREFAGRLNLPIPRVMQELMHSGILAAVNERIDFDTASIIAEDLGFKAVHEAKAAPVEDVESLDRVREAVEKEEKEMLKPRAPVIVIMGHVDHGKTRLLDAIRSTNVMESEAGGITQHIGAYQVERKNKKMTFIDTPGHEAFTVMRSRGAKVADIAILVVAADDGVQPQTKEAIDIIHSAKLPFIVALNKIDRTEANIDRVKGQLAEANVVPEDWGGKIPVVPISAKEKKGIDQLLDVLLLVNDLEQEKIVANPNRTAIGTVIESHVDPGTGAVATVLVQSGTLRTGDVLGIRDAFYGRVRAMQDWKGDQVKEAPPSTPVQIIGWKIAPAMGDVLEVAEDEKVLKKMKVTAKPNRATEEMAAVQPKAPEEGEEKKLMLNLIVRADALGSLEAILGMLDTIKHDDVGVKVIGKGLGNIMDSDVLNAEAGQAKIFGFNVNAISMAEQLARDKGVDVRTYKIIYRLFDDVLSELRKMLPSETVLTELGTCEVIATFRKVEGGMVVGCKGREGKIIPKAKLRVSRGGQYVGEGEVAALQIGRSEAKETRGGQEFGLQYKGKTKLEIGDLLEAYSEERVVRDLVIEGVTKR